MKTPSKTRNILVTGGAGFIGSHLCDELVKDTSCNVICVDNFITGGIENVNHLLQLPNFEFIKHDITLPLDLKKYPELKKFNVAVHGVQEIYHLACPTSSHDYYQYPIETIMTLSVGTKNILDLARESRASVVFASTGAVYGLYEKGKIFSEDDLGLTDTIGSRCSYIQGKRLSECLCSKYRELHQLDVKIARIFNIYGPRMKQKSGRLIPDMISRAINNEPVTLHRDGKDIITLCYIDDFISGLVKLMKSGSAGPINFGEDRAYEIIEVVKKIISLTSSSSAINFGEMKQYSAQYGQPDIRKAREVLGWFPVVSLEKGLTKVIADMKGSKILEYK